jgi:hypothetical protein
MEATNCRVALYKTRFYFSVVTIVCVSVKVKDETYQTTNVFDVDEVRMLVNQSTSGG